MANKSVRFSFLKEGIYYFIRRVPSDLRSHYATDRISFSLRTKSPREAEARALVHAIKLDEFWFKLRMNGGQVPGYHRLLNDEERSRKPSPTIIEAKELYLRLKGGGRPKTFHMGADRAVEYLIAASGNKALLAYTKSDATAFRDALYARKLSTSSVERVMTTVKAIVGFVLSEEGITAPNPFSGVYLNRQEKTEDRRPIPLEDIRTVQAKCHELDDDIRVSIRLGPQKSGSPMLTDEVAQALNAVGGKGHDAVSVVQAEDPDDAILRLHLNGDLRKPVNVFTEFNRNTVDGFDGAFLIELRSHG